MIREFPEIPGIALSGLRVDLPEQQIKSKSSRATDQEQQINRKEVI